MRWIAMVAACCLLFGCTESPPPAENQPKPARILPVTGTRFTVGYQQVSVSAWKLDLEIYTITDEKTGREYIVMARDKTLLELTGQPHRSPQSQPAAYE